MKNCRFTPITSIIETPTRWQLEVGAAQQALDSLALSLERMSELEGDPPKSLRKAVDKLLVIERCLADLASCND